MWRRAQGGSSFVTTYYATYFVLLLTAIQVSKDRQAKTILYWAALSGLFLFSAFRYRVGCDWWGYLINYRIWIPSYEFAFTLSEPGYWSVIHFLQQTGLPYEYLNVITSAIFFIGFHALARRQPNPLMMLALAVPILIINMPMSAIRQGAAIGFMCLAYVAFVDRRVVLYVVWILMGSLFHSSILAFLVFAPFVVGRVSRKNIIFASLLALPGAYGLSQTEAAEVAQQRYIDTGIDAAGAVFRLGVLSLSGLFFVRYVRKAWEREFPEDYKLVLIGAWLMVGFFGLFFVSTVIGDRFGYYLIPIQIMIFARIPYLQTLKNRQFWSVMAIAGLTLVFLVWTQLSSLFSQCYVPYRMRLEVLGALL